MKGIEGGFCPAFPAGSESNSYGGRSPQKYSGLTIQQYASIHLRIPNSGDPALDEMIRQSLRDEFAAKAMQGLLAQSLGCATGSDPVHGARYAYAMADAMLKAREEGGAA